MNQILEMFKRLEEEEQKNVLKILIKLLERKSYI